MATRISLRRDTTANWEEANPILANGEPGYDQEANELKVGDGVTAWLDLTTVAVEGPEGPAGEQGPPGPTGVADDSSVAALITDSESDTYAQFVATGSGLFADISITPTESRQAVGRGELVRNLLDFGADPTGVEDSTVAVNSWLDDSAEALKRKFYAPSGTYLCGDIVKRMDGRMMYGDHQRATVFKAVAGATRVFDFRDSGTVVLEDFSVDGDGIAECGLDLGIEAVGSSQRNTINRVRTLNCTDRGYDLTNNGDTIMRDTQAGPFPATATVCYWPNSGGNTTILGCTWFPAGTGADAPTRASFEGSFQNMELSGGAMMGLKMLDSSSSQTLRISGFQFYAILDGGNIIGPTTGSGVLFVTIDGASKLAVHAASQCYFDGNFRLGISVVGSTFNSGATDGTPNAFGANFVCDSPTQKLLMLIRNCVLRNESGATAASWNDTFTNRELAYDNFAGPTLRTTHDIVRAGTGVASTGLQVGNGIVIRSILSSTVTLDFPSIEDGGYATLTQAISGVTGGNMVLVSSGAYLPDGATITASPSAANQVRVTVHNNTGSALDLASASYRIYTIQV